MKTIKKLIIVPLLTLMLTSSSIHAINPFAMMLGVGPAIGASFGALYYLKKKNDHRLDPKNHPIEPKLFKYLLWGTGVGATGGALFFLMPNGDDNNGGGGGGAPAGRNNARNGARNNFENAYENQVDEDEEYARQLQRGWNNQVPAQPQWQPYQPQAIHYNFQNYLNAMQNHNPVPPQFNYNHQFNHLQNNHQVNHLQNQDGDIPQDVADQSNEDEIQRKRRENEEAYEDAIATIPKRQWNNKIAVTSKEEYKPKELENNTECSICLEDLDATAENLENGEQAVTTLTCGHKYCTDCLKDWVNSDGASNNRLCPACKVNIIVWEEPN